ncbi:NtaA/DmoA family FMN-dependent monooxygenase [Streptomyces echinatus]|uniref:FMN-dependent oxidoreductase (Nitrilotriacetate monooxygenase family) n=1 Tax=Streptomyces echinatus TaxID=67293 RepID=A0A7W9PYN4_9ACTN|nr:NtaA/DmoA family FMN-dependent monooxygenase [Streptomyces echinatus]MBB5930401.1 FMN-dependent oxidoreductase (nitrilotriacetate monooxygenase family) [Streptomyces echinatus]
MTAHRQLHLAVAFPGSGPAGVGPAGWAGAHPGSRLAFASFERLAHTAERGLFDFLLLDEEPPLPEHRGRLHELDPVGGPEPVAVLNALAEVTTGLGLAATVDAAVGEPYDLARRLATLDHLSAGRAGWRVADPADARPGADFRAADHLDPYGRAAELVSVARRLWGARSPGGAARPFAHRGRYFDIEGEFGLPRSPQGQPVVIQAGESERARELAAASADVLLVRHAPLETARSRHADVGRRLAAHGRTPGELKVMPQITVVLGDTAAEAQERAAGIRRQRITPQYALYALERIWGTDLSGYDPDGPFPDTAPSPGPPDPPEAGGSPSRDDRRLALAARWRTLAREKGLSVRETVIEASGRQSFVGTPDTVAADLHRYADEGAADGFVLLPQLPADGPEEFVDRVVPLLQERGAFRTAYRGGTLRSHLGLPQPAQDR